MKKASAILFVFALILALILPALAAWEPEANQDGTAKVLYFETPYAARALSGGLTFSDHQGVEHSLEDLEEQYVALVYGRTNCGYTLGVFETAYRAYLNGFDLVPVFLCVDNRGGPGEEEFAEQYPGALVSGEYSANNGMCWKLKDELELKTGYLPDFFLLDGDRKLVFACAGNNGAFCSTRLQAFLDGISQEETGDGPAGGTAEDEPAAAPGENGFLDSGLKAMPKLTPEEIRRLLEAASKTMPPEDEIFAVQPSVTAPYAPGEVSEALLQRTVDRLNALRAIAGVPAVTLDADLCKSAQYGAVLLAASGVFGHYPPQPEDMDDEFYALGSAATASSNLSGGSRLLSTPDGFMDDSDPGNISRLGHRRWQLNPAMGKIGFGYAKGGSYGAYTAEKVFDRSGKGGDYEYIAWPASGAFPAELFPGSVAWSVTVDPDKYAEPAIDGLTVTLTRESDGKTWTFSSGTSDGYYNVDTGGYGVPNCVIFRPDGIEAYQGRYTVAIDGLADRLGNPVDFAYEVDFFSLESVQPDSVVLQRFADVAGDEYFAPAVAWAVRNGVTVGTGDDTFSPYKTCTRAEVVTFLWRANGCPEPAAEPEESPFADVLTTDYFYKAVLWAVERGITQGTDENRFSPNQTCSHAHILTFLWRSKGRPGETGLGGWYDDAVAWAGENRLSIGEILPKNDCPRGDVVYYLYEACA